MIFMKKDLYYDSCGVGRIHTCLWEPEQPVKGIVQIVHGIAEYAERYQPFAQYLNEQGYLVVAEDHMGHGNSIGKEGIQGYFHGGWFAAVRDSRNLMLLMKKEYPETPYYVLGHSMGSFMLRTWLIEFPEDNLTGAIICGTGWMSAAVLQAGHKACLTVCRLKDERIPSEFLQGLAFGTYNKRVEHPRTEFDWLNRDSREVDAYIDDPLCGFTATAGLLRDMMGGMLYIQKNENLLKMNKQIPIHFIAGGHDPVGDYGKGVLKAAGMFRKAGMQTSQRIYPLCRHEILNEINKEEIFEDIAQWINSTN